MKILFKRLLAVLFVFCTLMIFVDKLYASTTVVSNESALIDASANSTYDTVQLGSNITVNQDLEFIVNGESSKTLDLNGYTLTLADPYKIKPKFEANYECIFKDSSANGTGTITSIRNNTSGWLISPVNGTGVNKTFRIESGNYVTNATAVINDWHYLTVSILGGKFVSNGALFNFHTTYASDYNMRGLEFRHYNPTATNKIRLADSKFIDVAASEKLIGGRKLWYVNSYGVPTDKSSDTMGTQYSADGYLKVDLTAPTIPSHTLQIYTNNEDCTFEYNGGTYSSGKSFTFPSGSDFTFYMHPAEGYYFINGVSSDAVIQQIDTNLIKITMPNKDAVVTLYFGQTVTPKYDVIFNSNGGSLVETQHVNEGERAYRPYNPTKENLIFDDWYTSNEFTEKFNFNTPIESTTQVYARWKASTTVIIYNSGTDAMNSGGSVQFNGGTTYTTSHTQNYFENDTVSLKATPIEGYTFVAWKQGNQYGSILSTNTQYEYSFTGYKTICAVFMPNQYTVQFNVGDIGAPEVASRQVYHGFKTEEPNLGVVNDQMIEGWYKDSAFTQKFNFNSDVVTSNMTLYAKWGPYKTYNPKASISANNNRLTISWNHQYKVTKYEVYRSENKKKWTKVATVTTDSYANSGLTYGKTYYYKVRAYDGKWTGYSNIVNRKVVPNKMVIKTYGEGSNNIKISWTKVPVTGYELYRSTDGKKWSKIKTITKNSTLAFNNTKLAANKRYYYKARAYKTVSGRKVYGSYSAVINTKTTVVKPAVTLSMRNLSEINIKIGTSKGASSYIVETSADGVSYSQIANLPVSGVLADGPVFTGDRYYYRVKACTTEKCSGWTYANRVATTLTPSVTLKTSSKKVTITVKSVEGADGYEVYRATKKNGKYTLNRTLLTENGVYTFNNSTKKGYYYYYKVRAYRIVGGRKVYSPFSGIKSIRSK